MSPATGQLYSLPFFSPNTFSSAKITLILIESTIGNKLPIGIAALLSFLGGFTGGMVVIPHMSQVWYTGPIAQAGTGDIGVLTRIVVAATLYAILRALEKKAFSGRSWRNSF